MFYPTRPPAAIARIHGGDDFPHLCGIVFFFPHNNGVLVSAHIQGLPTYELERKCFAFHIHEGNRCTGDDFADVGAHFDLHHQPHPYHTGDLPALFAVHGKACLACWTDRFRIRDIVGRTILIHEQADDYHTQPSGNAGKKIACGVILRNCCR